MSKYLCFSSFLFVLASGKICAGAGRSNFYCRPYRVQRVGGGDAPGSAGDLPSYSRPVPRRRAVPLPPASLPARLNHNKQHHRGRSAEEPYSTPLKHALEHALAGCPVCVRVSRAVRRRSGVAEGGQIRRAAHSLFTLGRGRRRGDASPPPGEPLFSGHPAVACMWPQEQCRRFSRPPSPADVIFHMPLCCAVGLCG